MNVDHRELEMGRPFRAWISLFSQIPARCAGLVWVLPLRGAQKTVTDTEELNTSAIPELVSVKGTVPNTPIRHVFAISVFTASFVVGCTDDCDVGTTWCEENAVMVCVGEEAEAETNAFSYQEENEYEESTWVDVLIAIFEIADAADGERPAEVVQSCDDADLVCAETQDVKFFSASLVRASRLRLCDMAKSSCCPACTNG